MRLGADAGHGNLVTEPSGLRRQAPHMPRTTLPTCWAVPRKPRTCTPRPTTPPHCTSPRHTPSRRTSLVRGPPCPTSPYPAPPRPTLPHLAPPCPTSLHLAPPRPPLHHLAPLAPPRSRTGWAGCAWLCSVELGRTCLGLAGDGGEEERILVPRIPDQHPTTCP